MGFPTAGFSPLVCQEFGAGDVVIAQWEFLLCSPVTTLANDCFCFAPSLCTSSLCEGTVCSATEEGCKVRDMICAESSWCGGAQAVEMLCSVVTVWGVLFFLPGIMPQLM